MGVKSASAFRDSIRKLRSSPAFFLAGLGAAVCLLAGGGAWTPAARAVVIDRIVAVVNKDIITLSEVQEAGNDE
ncbi:MAG: hypothetical protein ACE5IM_01035, partial [Nitrospinota bacterium]